MKATAAAAAPAPIAINQFVHLPVAAIAPCATNPRKHYDAAAIDSLAATIKEQGLIQPIIVRRIEAVDADYEIIAGHRRFKAYQQLGEREIPAIIRDMTDAQVARAQIIENLQREGLNAIEEADGYHKILGTDRTHAALDALAKEIGKSRSYVYGRLKLLDLCQEGRSAVAAGTLLPSVAADIARIQGSTLQITAMRRIEGLSARQAQAHLRGSYTAALDDDTGFDIAVPDYQDEEGKPIAGACEGCPKRSGNMPDLVAEGVDANVCTDTDCFELKQDAQGRRDRKVDANGKEIIPITPLIKPMGDGAVTHANGHSQADLFKTPEEIAAEAAARKEKEDADEAYAQLLFETLRKKNAGLLNLDFLHAVLATEKHIDEAAAIRCARAWSDKPLADDDAALEFFGEVVEARYIKMPIKDITRVICDMMIADSIAEQENSWTSGAIKVLVPNLCKSLGVSTSMLRVQSDKTRKEQAAAAAKAEAAKAKKPEPKAKKPAATAKPKPAPKAKPAAKAKPAPKATAAPKGKKTGKK